MRYIRKSEERGYVDMGWLKSHHSFSFGDYYDPQFMGYRNLRVINHDLIAGGEGFPLHGHRDMEIITYVLRGAVEHQDSLGNKAQTQAGDVQVMHAGRGIRHSEYNPLKDQELELLQIWIQPSQVGLEAGYTQRSFSVSEKMNRWALLASSSSASESGALQIHAEAEVFASVLKQGQSLAWDLKESGGVWLQVASGAVLVDGVLLTAGDGFVIEGESRFSLTGQAEQSELILFSL